MVFLEALEAMLSISLLVLVGFTIAYMKWVPDETRIFLPRLITKVVLPPYLMNNIVQHFTREQLAHMITSSLLPLASMVLCFFVFRLLAVLCRVDRHHRGLFAIAGTVSNTILIGIPVNTALFGDASLPYVLLYFFANTIFFWTVGAWILAREGTAERKHTFAERLAQIFSPPLCGVLLGILMVFIGIPMPAFLGQTCAYLGQLATPLALIFVGITLDSISWRKTHMGRDIILATAARLLVAPAVMIGILRWICPLPEAMAQVFIIQSALPCMAVISVVSAYYGADKEFGSTMVALTTVIGMLTIPVWMTVLTLL
ncbi:MAG: AEC family transporter [Desulfovibrio sp.]|nr:AEC family transporter [Desulfovibrio sp.]